MRCLRTSLLALCLLPSTLSPLPGFAQQSAGRPALSVTPEPDTTPVPPQAAPAASASSTAPGLPSNYVIGPDDTIQVTVWKEPLLSASLPVRPDGMISLPLVGDIQAAGFTPMQLGTNITGLLKKFVTDPNVNVTVMGVNSKHVYFIGEIGHVGPLAMTPGMSILQAISAAGGPSPYANRKHIYILRGEPGKQQKIFFDYNKAVKTGNMQGVVLEPGDTIVVPN